MDINAYTDEEITELKSGRGIKVPSKPQDFTTVNETI